MFRLGIIHVETLQEEDVCRENCPWEVARERTVQGYALHLATQNDQTATQVQMHRSYLGVQTQIILNNPKQFCHEEPNKSSKML